MPANPPDMAKYNVAVARIDKAWQKESDDISAWYTAKRITGAEARELRRKARARRVSALRHAREHCGLR